MTNLGVAADRWAESRACIRSNARLLSSSRYRIGASRRLLNPWFALSGGTDPEPEPLDWDSPEAGALSFFDPIFCSTSRLDVFLEAALHATLSLSGGTMGTLQLVQTNGALRIVAHAGFERPFLDVFSIVDGGTSCTAARARGRRVVVGDVTESPVFDPVTAEVMLAAGVRACQSTPLVGSSENVLGVLSTHYRSPRTPTDRELAVLDRVAARTAGWIQWKLGGS